MQPSQNGELANEQASSVVVPHAGYSNHGFPDGLFTVVLAGAAAQNCLPQRNTFGHFPGLKLSDTQRKPRKDRKWAVVSGDKGQNYKEIIESSKRWDDGKFKFFNVPSMGHTNASGKVLEKIFSRRGIA